MPNKLIHETSPYLLQHAGNPVDWYPWGPEALEKARVEHKPIFLSIGYAACHWCHVMEHESFEDPQTADLLNQNFVSIKVDREERPDLDGIYMNAVVAMTGQGGWPMSLFLTPEGVPFYGGTYFPNTPRYGMPSFKEVLKAITRSWNTEQDEIQKVSQEISKHLQESNDWNGAGGKLLQPDVLIQATQALISSYDWQMGGWGSAPRFPQPMAVDFLLMQATRGEDKALEAASHALQMMSKGGMYDVVGGGFHRYSTDNDWLVPHFEKMLYDNGLLALAYLHAYLLTGKQAFHQVCTQTLDFILHELTHPDGGFFSSLDADSEGVEGKYYVWTEGEIAAAIPDPADRAFLAQVYPLSPQGNFEGKHILQRKSNLGSLAGQIGIPETELISRLDALHQQLYEAREKRIRPLTDDKVLVSWNALALRAFSQAARLLKRADYLEAARKNARFILDAMYTEGHLMRSWRDGQAHHHAYLEDYAGLALALLDLYQSDPNQRWFDAALQLAEDIQTYFRDPQGGFFDTRSDQANLITRPKEVQDNAIPSGNALAANMFLRLAAYDERSDWHAQVEGMLGGMQDAMQRYPTAFAFWLQALDFAIGPVKQVALIGSATDTNTQSMLQILWQTYRPRTIAAISASTAGPEAPELLHERGMIQDKPTAYVCEGFVCNMPVNSPEAFQKQLEG